MRWPELVGLILASIALLGVGFVWALPWIIQTIIRVVLWPRYGFRSVGRQNVPRRGPVILVLNHVTWIDGLFIAAASPRHGHILANSGFFEASAFRAFARRAGMIPVPFSGPKAQRAAIVAVREALDRGELVAIFPEGQLTRNGLLGPFYRGLEVILKNKGDVTVVPVYLDNLWGSIWSFAGGRAFGKRPVGLRRTINVAFGMPMSWSPSLFKIRLGILSAGVDAVGLRVTPPPPLETIDPNLPHLDHPDLGPLTGSAPDYDRDGIVQPGQRPGTVGLPLPGVAIRIADEAGSGRCPQDTGEGRLQARVLGRDGWSDTGLTGRIDRDGFLTVD